MKLVSMKVSKAERKEKMKVSPLCDGDEYPYGTCISLNTAELEKLGLDVSGLSVGDTFEVEAQAVVKSISQNKRDGQSDNRLELQITKLGVEAEEDLDDNVSKAIDDAKEDY